MKRAADPTSDKPIRRRDNEPPPVPIPKRDGAIESARQTLVRGEHLDPALDADVLQQLADALLDDLQDDLLLRLAQHATQPFCLNVGASTLRARVLARIAADWPDAQTTIRLATSLPSAEVDALRDVFVCSRSIDVVLEMDTVEDAATIAALGAILKQAALRQWTLQGPGQVDASALTPLAHVGAHSIVLDIRLPPGQRNDAMEGAFRRIVALAFPSALDVSACHIDDGFAADLMRTVPRWERLTVATRHLAALADELYIHTLELRSHDPLVIDTAFLDRLARMGVDAFVTDAQVDLDRLSRVQAREWVSHLAACFTWKGGAGAQVVKDSLLLLPIVELVHRAHPGIGSPTQSDLALAKAMTQVTCFNQEGVAHWKSARRWHLEKVTFVVHLAESLSYGHTIGSIQELLQNSPLRNFLRYDAQALATLNAKANGLVPQVEALLHAKVPATFVRAALGQHLHSDSDLLMARFQQALGLPMRTARRADLAQVAHDPSDPLVAFVQELVHVPKLFLPLNDAEWGALFQPFSTPWMSTRLEFELGHKQNLLDKVTPATLKTSAAAHTQEAAANKLPTPRSANVEHQPRSEREMRSRKAWASVLRRQARQFGDADGRTPRHAAMFDESAARVYAHQVLADWLNGQNVDFGHLRQYERKTIATLLLERGEGNWLERLLPGASQWDIVVDSVRSANTLRDITAWPDTNVRCALHLPTGLPADALQHALDFACKVPAARLDLCIEVMPQIERNFWDPVTGYLTGRAGVRLSLERLPGRDAPIAQVTAFLKGIGDLPLAALELRHFRDAPDPGNTLAHAIAQLNTEMVTLVHCSDALTIDVMRQRTFQSLGVSLSDGIAKAFGEGLVSAKELVLHSGQALQPQWVTQAVAACKGLECVRTSIVSVDILALAQGLDRNRSVETVSATVHALSKDDEKRGRALLSANQSLKQMVWRTRINGGVPSRPYGISDSTMDALREMGMRHLLWNPVTRGHTTGRGFGWQYGRDNEQIDAFTDVFGHVGEFLDLPATQDLAFTCKAAYIGTRRPWEVKVEELAALLAPIKTLSAVVEHLQKMHQVRIDFESTPEDMNTTALLPKVQVMFHAGVPPKAIGEAMGLRWVHETRPAPALANEPRVGKQPAAAFAQGLAYAKAIPPTRWLEEVLGVRVRSIRPAGMQIRPL